MPTLRELQLDFASALLGTDDGAFGRRIAIYRISVFANAGAALRSAYPVVRRLVGDRFFDFAAREYVRRHPSVSGDIDELGGGFAGFVAAWPAAAGLTYLADVARLEWAVHETCRSAGAPCPVTDTVVAIPAKVTSLRFRMHPAARLVASPYPVLRIWEANQIDRDGEDVVDLAAGGIRLLVLAGDDLKIRFHPLEEGEYRLLQALSEGMTVAEAAERALDGDPGFDLGAALGAHLVLGTLRPGQGARRPS